MTHEQKPENADFRTHWEQANAISNKIRERYGNFGGLSHVVSKELVEAEARGAAEQRRKSEIEDEAENARFADADEESTLNALMWRHGIDREEASEELIWWQERDKRFPLNKAEQRRKDAEGAEGAEPVGYVRPDMMDFFRQSKAIFISASIIPKRDETHTEALYTRPANVAALEARVKELEGELGALLDWADGQWCPHDNTHRGGSIWTICNDCGRKWADDVKPFDPDEDFEPSAIKQARAAIREGGEHG